MTLKPPKRNSAPRMGSQLSRHSEIDIPLIVVTAITGIISWFIAKIMYSMELGTGILGFSDKFTWFVLWVLLALTIATRISHSINKSNRMLH